MSKSSRADFNLFPSGVDAAKETTTMEIAMHEVSKNTSSELTQPFQNHDLGLFPHAHGQMKEQFEFEKPIPGSKSCLNLISGEKSDEIHLNEKNDASN